MTADESRAQSIYIEALLRPKGITYILDAFVLCTATHISWYGMQPLNSITQPDAVTTTAAMHPASQYLTPKP